MSCDTGVPFGYKSFIVGIYWELEVMCLDVCLEPLWSFGDSDVCDFTMLLLRDEADFLRLSRRKLFGVGRF